MSNAYAIAAVTRTLAKNLDVYLKHFFSDTNTPNVTAKPPDKVDSATDGINLYLYHIALNSSWRNENIPWQSKPGELRQSPLALNLYYLLSAYSAEEVGDTLVDEIKGSHRLLGMAMSILHDYPVLTAKHINDYLAEAGVTTIRFAEKEKVRVTPHPLTLDDLSKIWTGFQASYRLAVAYEVSTVLIETTRPNPSALPVLQRGSDDHGSYVIGELFPTISNIYNVDANKHGFSMGDRVEIKGIGLSGDHIEIYLTHSALEVAAQFQPNSESKQGRLIFDLVPAESLAAGIGTVQVVIQNNQEPFKRTTNKVPIPISPTITVSRDVTRVEGIATIEVTCIPDVYQLQQVSLLIADKEIQPQPLSGISTGTLTFEVPFADDEITLNPDDPDNLDKGYVARLRVDGVDSSPVVFKETSEVPSRKIMVFDPNQRVIIR